MLQPPEALRSFLIVIAVGVILVQSCDPARILVVKASKKPGVSVAIYANENILPRSYPYSEDSIPEKIVVRIPTTDSIPRRKTVFGYGLGTWGDSALMPGFSKDIDSIIIINIENKLTLNHQAEINDYLLEHRHGFAKRILTIKAK